MSCLNPGRQAQLAHIGVKALPSAQAQREADHARAA